MKGISKGQPSFFRNYHKLFQSLSAKIVLIHLRQVFEENNIIIRFENGYGVTISPVSLEGNDEVFQMIVIRFYGTRINDYKIAQYVCIPELNRGNFEEIIALCKQVSLFPKSQTITVTSDRSKGRVKKAELKKCCSNFQ